MDIKIGISGVGSLWLEVLVDLLVTYILGSCVILGILLTTSK